MKMNLDKIKEIYGSNYLYEINENIEEVVHNMNFLVKRKFSNVYELLEMNPYIFLLPTDIFEEKVDNLIKELGIEYKEKIEEDMSIWSNLDD